MKAKFPFVLAILGMVGGVVISIVFGVNEGERAEKMKVEAYKNWRYYQRYHFHAPGVGSMSLVLLIFLGFIQASKTQILTSSYMISIGGFLYPFVWLFAGIYGPEMGRDQAKEAFAIFGYMGGVCLMGMIFATYLAISKPLKAPLGEA